MLGIELATAAFLPAAERYSGVWLAALIVGSISEA